MEAKMIKKFVIHENAAIVSLSGELDQYAAAALKSKIDIETEASHKHNLIMDLSDVTFMDSSGIGLIIGRYKLMKAIGGKIAVCGGNKGVKKVIELSGLTKIIPYYESPEEALDKIESGRVGRSVK